MIQELNHYIDVCLIDEHAHKSFSDGYSLDLDDLNPNDIDNFLFELMKHDTNVRDIVHHHMQTMINERLGECEARDRENAGLTLRRMSNGDFRLERSRW